MQDTLITSGTTYVVGSASPNGHHNGHGDKDKISIPIPFLIVDSIYHNVDPPTGSKVRCQHCDSIAFSIISDCIHVVHRHGHSGQYHKTVVSLRDLGYERIKDG